MKRVAHFAAVAVLLSLTAALGAQSAQTSAQSRGYRLRGYQWDPILAQRWAVLEDAAHPERPLLAELAPESGAAIGPAAGPYLALAARAAAAPPPPKLVLPVVRSGDPVTLWRDETNLRMQLAAIAEGNAGIGERIQLRVTGAGVYGNTGWRVTGIVRGPGSVEMEQ